MSYYFPIPPNIRLDTATITASITIFNNPSNQLSLPWSTSNSFRRVYINLFERRNRGWLLSQSTALEPFESSVISSSYYQSDPGTLHIIVLSRRRYKLGLYPELPKPVQINPDNSPAAERATYTFALNSTKIHTCFLGEYPYQMSNLSRSSFISTNILSQANPNIHNILLLVNINRLSSCQTRADLSLKTLTSVNTHIETINPVFTNSFSLVPDLPSKHPILLSCPTHSFIPLSVAYSLDPPSISVEHTHPPHESLWGSSRGFFVHQIKRNLTSI